MSEARRLNVAAGFLTVVPMPRTGTSSDQEYGRSVTYFPVVGALLGAFVAGVDTIAGRLLPAAVTSALALALFAALTGGLHLDGLMDSCDGLFGGRDRERRLAIMRDSRVGSYGVICGVLVILLQWSSLLGLHGSTRAAAVILAPMLGRWGMAVAVWAFPYARAEGRGTAFKMGLLRRHLVQAGLWTILATAALGASGLWLPALAAISAVAIGRWISARLGGLTGDNYGAICELITMATLVACSARVW